MIRFFKRLFSIKATEADLRSAGWAWTTANAQMEARIHKDMADMKQELVEAIEEVALTQDLDQSMMTLSARNIVKMNNLSAALVDYLGLKAECDDEGIYKISPRPKPSKVKSARLDK